MADNKQGNVTEFRPDTKDTDSGSTGWDPYIFSIFANRKKSYPDERRSKPRTRDASRRRALLLAQGRRKK